MRKILFFSILLCTIHFSGSSEEIKIPGFGNQLILTNQNLTPALILKRTMGATKYKMTPGDTYQFTAQIDTTITVPIVLDDNYQLELPFIGSMDVRGMYFSDVRNTIIKKLKAKGLFQFVDFTLTSMALIDVLVYGGVENPGIATVTPLSTLWEAVLLAKGLKKGASYRTIELVRQDKKTIIDLARFVRDGDMTQNPYLEPGDKIYIPHASIVCSISGSVMFPDTYEMTAAETLYDLVKYSGGFLPGSYQEDIEVARMGADGITMAIEKATFSTAKSYRIKNGDRIRIKSIAETKDFILVEGALFGKQSAGDEPQVPPTKPIVVSIPFIEGMTILQLIDKLGGITPLAAPEKSYVVRESTKERIPVDVKKLLDKRDPSLDVKLLPEDHVFIPMQNLTVAIGGEVVTPGAFPYQTGTKVIDYVKLAGGIKADTADMGAIYLMDDTGRSTHISLDTEVAPGALIYIGKSGLNNAATGLSQVGVIVGFAASLIALVVATLDLIDRFQ